MSNTDIKNTATNQELLMNLNEKNAETISGGQLRASEIRNFTNQSIDYTVDGEQLTTNPSNEDFIPYNRGLIEFQGGNKLKSSYLKDGRIYAFKLSRDGIDLYDVGAAW